MTLVTHSPPHGQQQQQQALTAVVGHPVLSPGGRQRPDPALQAMQQSARGMLAEAAGAHAVCPPSLPLATAARRGVGLSFGE
jgi:hypothetical protein